MPADMTLSTHLQQHVLRVLSTRTISEAALVLGVTERSIYNWKKQWGVVKVDGKWVVKEKA